MDTKTIAFILVGVLVGAAVGVGAGYLVWGEDDGNNEQTYWFYVDYGDSADATHVNGWYSAKSSDPLHGLYSAIGDSSLNGSITRDDAQYPGWISSINGIESSNSLSWMSWYFNGQWQSNDSGFSDTFGTFFYIGYTGWNPTTYESNMNPNETAGWQNSGPFATA